jgi:hypothetical protein
MGTGRLLMLISETLAVVAVATQLFLPTGMGIGLHLAHRYIGLPVLGCPFAAHQRRWRIESHSSFQHVLAACPCPACDRSVSVIAC